MDTVIKKIMHDDSDDEIYEQAAEILKNGGLVAFPTETVYGLGADALDEKASAKIYAAKGRPSDNPLIVHIADKKDLEVLSCDVNDMAVKAAEAFWPGPLTMILKERYSSRQHNRWSWNGCYKNAESSCGCKAY